MDHPPSPKRRKKGSPSTCRHEDSAVKTATQDEKDKKPSPVLPGLHSPSRVSVQTADKCNTVSSATDLEHAATEGDSMSEGKQNERKRQMNIIYSRRKREKKKLQLEILRSQCADLHTVNQHLNQEAAMLQDLFQQAQLLVLQHERSLLLDQAASIPQQQYTTGAFPSTPLGGDTQRPRETPFLSQLGALNTAQSLSNQMSLAALTLNSAAAVDNVQQFALQQVQLSQQQHAIEMERNRQQQITLDRALGHDTLLALANQQTMTQAQANGAARLLPSFQHVLPTSLFPPAVQPQAQGSVLPAQDELNAAILRQLLSEQQLLRNDVLSRSPAPPDPPPPPF